VETIATGVVIFFTYLSIGWAIAYLVTGVSVPRVRYDSKGIAGPNQHVQELAEYFGFVFGWVLYPLVYILKLLRPSVRD
jgi:Na+/proline symporter